MVRGSVELHAMNVALRLCTIYGTDRASAHMPVGKITLVFFQNAAGHEPVRDWLKVLPVDDRRAIGQDLMRLQCRWPVGMPLCRNLGAGLWEVRSSLPNNRIARVIFRANAGQLVALHGFIKKSERTPKGDLELARSRSKELDT